MATPSFKDRVVELRRVKSDQIADNQGNFRVHPQAQKNALRAAMAEIGIADALIAYHSKRNGGKLTLIDGHMRKAEHDEWPVLVTDLTDEEADLMLQAADPIAAMAINDKVMLDRLRSQARFKDASMSVALDALLVTEMDKPGQESSKEPEAASKSTEAKDDVLPEMELQPYEHYDYVLVLARNTMDWNYLVDRLKLAKVNGSTDVRYRKAGLGRAIPAERLIEVLRQADEVIASRAVETPGRSKKAP